MDRDREQFWLVAACVLVAHGIALAAITAGWVFWARQPAAERAQLSVTPAPPIVQFDPPPPPEPDPTVALGEADGEGDSIATVDSPLPLTSKSADQLNQAWTRQKRVPLPREKSEAGESTSPSLDAKEAASPLGPMSVSPVSPIATQLRPAKDKLLKSPDPQPQEQAPEALKADHAAQSPKQQFDAKAAEKPETAPDSAEQGDSDLDPFAKEESIDDQAGGTQARSGREVKIARARVDLAVIADVVRIGHFFEIVMFIETDATGHPKRVRVLKSSGSDVIDDAVKLAMYDSWFGKPMPDRFRLTWRFVRD